MFNAKAALAALFAVGASMASAEPTLMRSNVATCDGTSASGFTVIGGTVQRFVSYEAGAAHTFCNAVTIVPQGVDVYDLGEVQAYLASLGISAAPALTGDRVCSVAGFNVRTCPGAVETVYSARSDNWWQQGGWLRSPAVRPEESEWSI